MVHVLNYELALQDGATPMPSIEAYYGPYSDIDTAYSKIYSAFGTKIPIGLTFAVKNSANTIVEYWFNGGIEKDNIEKKNNGGNGSSYSITDSVFSEPEWEITVSKGATYSTAENTLYVNWDKEYITINGFKVKVNKTNYYNDGTHATFSYIDFDSRVGFSPSYTDEEINANWSNVIYERNGLKDTIKKYYIEDNQKDFITDEVTSQNVYNGYNIILPEITDEESEEDADGCYENLITGSYFLQFYGCFDNFYQSNDRYAGKLVIKLQTNIGVLTKEIKIVQRHRYYSGYDLCKIIYSNTTYSNKDTIDVSSSDSVTFTGYYSRPYFTTSGTTGNLVKLKTNPEETVVFWSFTDNSQSNIISAKTTSDKDLTFTIDNIDDYTSDSNGIFGSLTFSYKTKIVNPNPETDKPEPNGRTGDGCDEFVIGTTISVKLKKTVTVQQVKARLMAFAPVRNTIATSTSVYNTPKVKAILPMLPIPCTGTSTTILGKYTQEFTYYDSEQDKTISETISGDEFTLTISDNIEGCEINEAGNGLIFPVNATEFTRVLCKVKIQCVSNGVVGESGTITITQSGYNSYYYNNGESRDDDDKD